MWLPGGGVDSNEQLEDAARRKTFEETGVVVDITGVLRVEFTNQQGSSHLRVIYFATPTRDSTAARTVPNYESPGGCWATVSEVEVLRKQRALRGDGPYEWFQMSTTVALYTLRISLELWSMNDHDLEHTGRSDVYSIVNVSFFTF
mmetsp:Transcript_2097/g.3115  ORF Transcript_2097/g.3115 Transcript_2097/m.3115 type:complete len:146 (+) Transcript_2097:3060-3497(+)